MAKKEAKQTLAEKLRNNAYLVTIFLKAMGVGMFVAQSQYLYRRVALSYTDDLTSLENVTSDDSCSTSQINTSSVEYQIHAEISAETSRWNMYLALCNGIPTILIILILGAYSDQVGRRFLFLISLAGTAIKGILMTIIIYFDLHVGFMIVGDFIEGLCGGYPSLIIASFSYTSDQHIPESELTDVAGQNNSTYDKASVANEKENKEKRQYDIMQPTAIESDGHAYENPACSIEDESGAGSHGKPDHPQNSPAYDSNRAVRVLAIECFNIASMGIVQLINGYFIAYAGFFYVVLTGTLIIIADFVFTWFVIKNADRQVKKKRSILTPLKIVLKAIRQPRKLSAFILCNLAIMLVVFGDGGLIRTMPIYQMSPPFCWSSVQIGWFNSEFYFVTLWAVPFLMVLKRFGLSEPTMAGIGTTINAIGTAIYALANVYSWIFYVVAVLTAPGMLAYAFTRTITSRLAGPEAHGAMFAFTSLVEQTMWLVGSVTGSGIYQVTVSKLQSAVFIYFAALYFSAALVYYLEGCIERRLSPYRDDKEHNVNATAKADQTVATENGAK